MLVEGKKKKTKSIEEGFRFAKIHFNSKTGWKSEQGLKVIKSFRQETFNSDNCLAWSLGYLWFDLLQFQR